MLVVKVFVVQELYDVDAKFQALAAAGDAVARDGDAAAAGVGALVIDKRRRPQRQNAFAHFKKARCCRGCWRGRLQGLKMQGKYLSAGSFPEIN